MGKLISFISGLLGKLILLGLALLLAGVLYVGAYFYVKSGEPMTVAEAQRLAPGLTFRDFWASRVDGWDAQNVDYERIKGRPATCDLVGAGVITARVPFYIFITLIMREKNDPEYSRKILAGLNNPPPVEIIHNAPYLDAVWTLLEAEAWHGLANSSGVPGGPELNHRRYCTTTYPTPADVSANHTQETGTMP